MHSYDSTRLKVQASFLTITRLHAKTCVFRQGVQKQVYVGSLTLNYFSTLELLQLITNSIKLMQTDFETTRDRSLS